MSQTVIDDSSDVGVIDSNLLRSTPHCRVNRVEVHDDISIQL